MRDPFRVFRGGGWFGIAVVAVLVLGMAAVLAVYMLQPSRSADEAEASQALEVEMERNAAASAARQRAVDAERKADFE